MGGETRRLWAKRALLLTLSTLFSLALGEVAMRALALGDPILRDVDPVLGWAPVPGAEGWWTREGRGRVVITEHGFRGVDVPEAKGEGTLRVAILGDSYTEARQVALEDSYPERLETLLDACADRPVEVLAFGVSGYGTTQERLLLEHRVWPFDPDLVLVAFLTGNDIADNHAELRASGDPAPYFTLEGERLVLDASFTEAPEYRTRAEGGVWRGLRRRSQLLRVLSGIWRAPRAREGRGELGLRDEVYRAPTDATWTEAWARTEAILGAMAGDTAAHGAQFGVVTLSNAIQVHPDPDARARFADELGVPDLEAPDRRIAEVGEREGFEVLSLVGPLREYAEAHDMHLHGFPNTAMGAGHWNEEGHRVAAQTLAPWLCRRLGSGDDPEAP